MGWKVKETDLCVADEVHDEVHQEDELILDELPSSG